jgi:hypothetical protein
LPAVMIQNQRVRDPCGVIGTSLSFCSGARWINLTDGYGAQYFVVPM